MEKLDSQPTIYALSSGAVPSGVAVIRVSGSQVIEIAKALIGAVPLPRQATLLSIRTRNNDLIDSGLVLFFQSPHSFTGEDCLEFQIHGGRAVVLRLLEELSGFPNTRMAEAGEFTRRAFENGKIDLVEAEGLADLISAETEMQRRLAVEHSRGGLSALYDGWSRRLTHARAMIEAELDFADEDDVPGSVADRIWIDMQALHTDIMRHLQAARTGEIIRDGLKIVILGRPNAGKSSLLNALARRDVAIVTSIPGTTRDVLSIDLDIQGYAVRLFDTAGLRETDDLVEQEGVHRAKLAAEDADLLLVLEDLTQREERMPQPAGKDMLRVGTKVDLALGARQDQDVFISTATGEGMDALLGRISDYLQQLQHGNSLAIPSRIRHVSHLKNTAHHLASALADEELALDLRAEHLRLAAHSLGRITGAVDVEQLLDVIFSEFCIGK